MSKIICQYKLDSRTIELFNFALYYVYDTDISSPPTDAELDELFDEPANLHHGWTAYINNGKNIYLIMTNGLAWFYEELSLAS